MHGKSTAENTYPIYVLSKYEQVQGIFPTVTFIKPEQIHKNLHCIVIELIIGTGQFSFQKRILSHNITALLQQSFILKAILDLSIIYTLLLKRW